jgi:predicted HTH transcriptional regulator
MAKQKLRVFISSVQKELEVERVFVSGMVSTDSELSSLCDIVLFEKEPLSGKKAAKPYLRCLAGCDVYVLILGREYGEKGGLISATHEEYRFAQEKNMPILIFIRGKHDLERHKKTQDFFEEIKKDGHTYRRFHDRQDLGPELKKSLIRVLQEIFHVPVKSLRQRNNTVEWKVSAFEQQELNVSANGIDLAVASRWLQLTTATNAQIMNHLREKGLVRRNSEGSGFSAMASGLIFLGKNPSLVFPHCKILVDAYTGTELDSTPKDQMTLSEPVPSMIEKIIDFIIRNTRHPIQVVGIRRVSLDEYPTTALREAVVNAIAHRNYDDAARSIYVRLFFDRIEVLSPGDLMPPLTIAKLLKGTFNPCSRNPILAQYLAQFGLMEQRGSGILRMKKAMIDHGLNAPQYSYKDGFFTVTLKGPGADLSRIQKPVLKEVPVGKETVLSERQKEIARWLAEGEAITNQICQKRLRISKVTAMNDLKELVNAGLAEQTGKGRSVRYIYKAGKR